MQVLNILKSFNCGHHPTLEELQYLYATELSNPQQARVFDIRTANGLEKLKKRSQLFREVYPQINQLCQELGFEDSNIILFTLWRLWLPLAIQLSQAKETKRRTYIVGILGGQGTGKTTLTKIIHLILYYLNYQSFSLSIDDIYKTYEERKTLKQSQGLIWRGPPGTHDIEAGIQVLDQALQTNRTESILIPRFDKYLWNGDGDRIEPEQVNPPIDIVMFEGWFVGVRPVDDTVFDNPSSPIASVDKQFARDNNQRLRDYLPLWERLDYLMILYPVDYCLSKQWRKEAEHKMIAQGKKGMSDEEIDQFVEYFWKALHPEIFITPLIQNPDLADLVVEINRDRSVGMIYKPGINSNK